MHKKLLAGAAMTAFLTAGAASAQDWYNPTSWFTGGGFYVGADGGYHFPETFKGSATAQSGQKANWDFGTNSDNNWAAFGKIGYKHPSGLRLELEYGYRNGDLDSIHGQAADAQPNGLCTPGVTRTAAAPVCGGVSGSQNVSSLMFNVLYDFQNFTLPGRFPVRPFIGGGVGGAFVQTKAYGALSGTPAGYSRIENASFDDNKSAFAYQGIAGITYDVAPHFSIDLTGRYFEADRVRAPSVSTYAGAGATGAALPVYALGNFKGDYKDASVTIGLRYTFGGDKAAPPPPPPPPPAPEPAPPPPPPAPAPVQAAPEARQFVVYFPFDQAILTTDAQAVVQSASDYAKSGNATRIVVVGHTDTSGSTKYNLRLSERRAKTVADALVGLGVAQTTLSVDWKGKTDLAVPTPDGVKEPLNRRATIDINFQ